MASAHVIDLERSRSVSEIMRSTAKLYGDYPWLFLILAAAVVVPWDLARLAITGAGPLGHPSPARFGWLSLIDFLLVTPLVSALHVHAVRVIGEGRRPPLRAVAWSGVRSLRLVAVVSVLASVGIMIGFVLLVLPGILLMVFWAVVAQAAAIEGGGVRRAFGRSVQLTTDHGWHVFGLLFVIWILTVTLGVAGAVFGAGADSSAGPVALGTAIDTIVYSFTALTTALLYFDLAARPERVRTRPLTETNVST
jgi:hypothetical protein